MNVAVEGNDLSIEFFSPAASIVGFEHQPGTQEQKDAVKEAIKRLKAAEVLFNLPLGAQGRLAKSMVADIDKDSDREFKADHTDKQNRPHEKENDLGAGNQKADGHEHGRHSDFTAAYDYHFPGGQGINPVQGVFHIAGEKHRRDRRMPYDNIVIGPIGGLQRAATDLKKHAGLLAFEIRQPLLIHTDMTVEAIFIGLRVSHMASSDPEHAEDEND
jgi:hypothetical protein